MRIPPILLEAKASAASCAASGQAPAFLPALHNPQTRISFAEYMNADSHVPSIAAERDACTSLCDLQSSYQDSPIRAPTLAAPRPARPVSHAVAQWQPSFSLTPQLVTVSSKEDRPGS
jgi:hypothetical protein